MLFRYAFLWALVVTPVHAGEANDDGANPSQALFGFGGIFTDEDMGTSLRPFHASYEDNYLVGVGYQNFVYERSNLSLGFEGGMSARTGGRLTGEVWGGAVGRYDGLPTVLGFQVSPAMTFGLSAVTAAHRGREQKLEERYDGNASLLFYLGPEINFSHSTPGPEVFWRLHHRSGAWRTLGDMKGAMNGNVLGVRLRF